MSAGFEAALLAHGLLPGRIVADGKWRRCATRAKPKRRNGAYVLRMDGSGRYVGWYMDWANDSGPMAWNAPHAPRQQAREAQALRQHLDAQDEQQRQRQWQAILAAQAFWAAAHGMRGLHPYLAAKGLSAAGCQHLRQSGDRLLVPVMRGNRLISVQSIAPDGQKRFFKGAPVRGGYCVLERPRAALTCICEGLATGLAVYQSAAHARVIVAFNAGNLAPAARVLQERGLLRGKALVCADNDHATQKRTGRNPGLEKAQEAARLLGAGLAFPADIQGSDWADALQEYTLAALLRHSGSRRWSNQDAASRKEAAGRIGRLILKGMRNES